MKKEISVQIFTGGYTQNKVTYEQVEAKLKPLLDAGPVTRVIMGWSLQKPVYQSTIELLKRYGVQCFVWLPVFSETGLIKPVTRLLDDEGNEVKSYHLKEGENFEFYCPQDKKNIRSFLSVFEENFADLGFDGVFLDKIRYGAFSNGLNGVFSCFCPNCLKTYELCGLDAALLKNEMRKVRLKTEGYDRIPLKIKGYEQGKYQFENNLWKVFFQKKQDDIVEAMTELVDYFHGRQLLVGMDTFSPFTAYFAGQDVVRLGKLADFIKPMMYRITDAPAGLPFEASCLLREITGGTEEAAHHFYRMIRCRRVPGKPFDMEFVKRELKILTDQGISTSAGVEINQNEAAPADPAYIRENLRELEAADIEGFVLSWDLLSAPEENIAEIMEYLRQRR